MVWIWLLYSEVAFVGSQDINASRKLKLTKIRVRVKLSAFGFVQLLKDLFILSGIVLLSNLFFKPNKLMRISSPKCTLCLS